MTLPTLISFELIFDDCENTSNKELKEIQSAIFSCLNYDLKKLDFGIATHTLKKLGFSAFQKLFETVLKVTCSFND